MTEKRLGYIFIGIVCFVVSALSFFFGACYGVVRGPCGHAQQEQIEQKGK